MKWTAAFLPPVAFQPPLSTCHLSSLPAALKAAVSRQLQFLPKIIFHCGGGGLFAAQEAFPRARPAA
jgi:hypothetical protein